MCKGNTKEKELKEEEMWWWCGSRYWGVPGEERQTRQKATVISV